VETQKRCGAFGETIFQWSFPRNRRATALSSHSLIKNKTRRRIYFNEHSVRRFLVEPGKLRVDFLGCARFHNKQFLPKRRCGVAR
jgi:hypothetical protein